MRREKRYADAANKVFRQLERLRQKRQRKNSSPVGFASHDGGDSSAAREPAGGYETRSPSALLSAGK